MNRNLKKINNFYLKKKDKKIKISKERNKVKK